LVDQLKSRAGRPGEGNNWLKMVPAAIALMAFISVSGFAHADTRTLKLHFVHTGEKAEITYKRNGKYIDSGLQQANRILRDFRRNEPTKMDPKLLDLVWEVYQASGSRGYINVISAYRSPTTNSMLRSRGRGVAKNSQHTLGRAMDFFLTDVKLSKVREIGLKMGAGGVGFYPTSGSPFVHLDTGRVRHWPRMSRQELARIFPDGKTMHVPTDGKPLPRYEQALAEYKSKGKQSAIVVASAEEPKKKGFFERLAGGADDEASEDDEGPTPGITSARPVAVAAAPAETADESGESAALSAGVNAPPPPQAGGQAAPVPSAEVGQGAPENVPVPEFPERATETAQSDEGGEDELSADRIPVPTRRPEPVMTASVAAPAESAGQFAVAALSPAEIENLRRTAVPSSQLADTQQVAAISPAATQKPAQNKPSAPLPKVAATELALLSQETPAAADAAASLIASGAAPAAAKESGPSRQTLELALAATNENSTDALQAIRDLIDSGAPTEIETADAEQPAAPAKRKAATKAAPAAKGTWKDRIGRYALAAVRDIGLVRDLKAPGYTAPKTEESFVVAGFTKTAAPATQNGFATDPETPSLKVRTN
jgi:uncharacterized protein YcbK (DUF882 family)